jgi:hypothetical protein
MAYRDSVYNESSLESNNYEQLAKNFCGLGTETVQESRGGGVYLPLEVVTRELVNTQLTGKKLSAFCNELRNV